MPANLDGSSSLTPDMPASRLDEAAENLDQSGLAATGEAKHGHSLTSCEIKQDVPKAQTSRVPSFIDVA